MYNFKKNIISILLLGIFVFTPLVNINAQTQNSNCYSNSTKPCFSSISVSRNDKEATVWFSTIDNSVDEFQISVSLFKSDNTLFTGNSVQIKKSDIVAGITPSVKLGKNYNNTPDLDLSPNTFYLAKIVLIWTIDTGGVKNIYADNYFASFTTRQTGGTVLMEDKNTTTIDYGSNTEKCEEYYTDPNKPTNAQTNPPGPQKKWWYNTHYQNLGIPQWSGPFSSKEDCQKIDQTLLLSPNNSLSSNKDWYYKPTKDADAKGPFSSIAECEKERAKGNSYSKQCFQFYYPLAPLPGQADKIDTSSSGDSDCPFGNYLNILIKLFIGICAVLAMIKIVLGGMQYMTSELSSGKEDGKNSITSAVFGLILALGAFAILNTINPELLKVCLNNLPKATVLVGDDSLPQSPINGKYCTKTAGANGGYVGGSDWTVIAGSTAILPSGVTDNHSGADCTYVGQKNCTSTRGLDLSKINAIATSCKTKNGNVECPIKITGGTECWLHGGVKQNTNHQKNKSTIDISATPLINKYFTGKESFPNDNNPYGDTIKCNAEPALTNASTSAKHWHCE